MDLLQSAVVLDSLKKGHSKDSARELTIFSSMLISKRPSFSRSPDRVHAALGHDDVHGGHGHDEINALRNLSAAAQQPYWTFVKVQRFDLQT